MGEEVAAENPDRFKLWYTIDRPGDDWKYSSGFINAEMIEKSLFAPSEDNLVLMCGPPPMINFACIPNLDKLGYSQHQRFSYWALCDCIKDDKCISIAAENF